MSNNLSQIWLSDYNNYFNRIIKRDAEGQFTPEMNNLGIIPNINFIPNDDINTEIILNLNSDQTKASYLIEFKDAYDYSRWFILHIKRLRTGQYKLQLRRDLLVDYWGKVGHAAIFLQKGWVDSGDPFIFNKEPIEVNQIKKNETPLYDETGCPWIVGYIPSDYKGGDTVEVKYNVDATQDFTVSGLENWEYFNYINKVCKNGSLHPFVVSMAGKDKNIGIVLNDNGDAMYTPDFNEEVQDWNTNLHPKFTINNSYYITQYYNSSEVAQAKELLKPKYGINDNDLNVIRELDDKIIKDTSGDIYYQVKIIKSPVQEKVQVHCSQYDAFFNLMWGQLEGTGKFYDGQVPWGNAFGGYSDIWTETLILQQITRSASYTTSTVIQRFHLNDAPYDMFAIPYTDNFKDGNLQFQGGKSLALNSAINLGTTAGKGNLYDLQILPYCPVRYGIKTDNSFSTLGVNKIEVKDGSGTVLQYIYWANSSSFSFDLPCPITVDDVKLSNQCDVYRFVSPNYSGIFEFNAAMNYGLDKVNVDLTYKPYNPWIHITPNFKGLYGSDYNDQRGLICSGDFSLPQMSDAWANYQMNNKNYQEAFNREVQNLQKVQGIQRQQELITGITGAFQGGMHGAMAGGVMGGPLGAAAGLIGGTVMSGAGAALDMKYGDELREENLAYKNDMFKLQLGNIQAIPTSISKTTSLNANSKYVPFLEYYTCSEKEKVEVKNKIKYSGMTIMRTQTLNEVLDVAPNNIKPYVKGTILRIDTPDGEAAIWDAISSELNKGVYLTPSMREVL